MPLLRIGSVAEGVPISGILTHLIAKHKKNTKRDPLKYCNVSMHELEEPRIQKQSAYS